MNGQTVKTSEKLILKILSYHLQERGFHQYSTKFSYFIILRYCFKNKINLTSVKDSVINI